VRLRQRLVYSALSRRLRRLLIEPPEKQLKRLNNDSNKLSKL
jgi:hypothetical protein